MITTTTKRIGWGLLTAIAVAIAFDLLPNLVPASLVHVRLLGFFYIWSAVESALVMFVAALAGAYVARVPFVVPAVMLVAVNWSLTVYFSNSIATAAGQGDLLAVAGSNIPGLILGGVGATIGAWYGHYER